MTDYSKQTSFWNLLKNERIEIPIIQRDYAQGRMGQEYLRERFLKQLFQALESGRQLVLDFVYGSYENNTLYPLDGQQRLTTLWLLHWYLSLCRGSLAADGETLARFSYMTRVSSRKFCEKMCSIRVPYNRSEGNLTDERNIVSFIKNQHWFYSAYEQDPTIQSMLRMLGGTTKADKDGNDIIDGIEEKCSKLTDETLCHYLGLLQSENSPIRFYTLDMQDNNLPLSDDLYIKMNARGKVLTDFENFKVDLLNYHVDDEKLLIAPCESVKNSFSHLLDTQWTDMFWHHRSQEHKIDAIFFEFLNRFFLSWFIAHHVGDGKPESVTGHDLYTNLADKNTAGYKNIQLYEPVLKQECIQDLYTCMNNLHALYEMQQCPEAEIAEKVNNLFVPWWSKEKEVGRFYFIPTYLDNGSISTISVQQRVATHAIFVYLRNCSEVSIDSLKAWMHFVWNILENSYVDREQSVSAIRFFDKTLQGLNSSYNMVDDIVSYLASLDESNLPYEIFGRRQLKEEIIKAKKSLESDDWKEKIDEAETLYFFKGAISFLFNDAKGELCEDIELFNKKFERAKTIFDENGLKTEHLFGILQRLYSYCEDWGAQLWWSHKIFNGLASTWKDNILTAVDRNYQYIYASPVHHILIGDEPYKFINDQRIRVLANKPIIKFLIEQNKNKRDMYIRNPHDALYFCGDKHGILLSHGVRDHAICELLGDNRFQLIGESIRIPGTDHFWGFDIDLSFQIEQDRTINFRWYRERTDATYDIYILNDNLEYKFRSQERLEERGDRRMYCCFNVETNADGSINIDKFIECLKTESNDDNI